MPPDKASSLPSPILVEFEGPLDLLLDEVRRQRVAIEEIALAPMVARFLDYVRSAIARGVPLEMEWLHLAATLIHWKSRRILVRTSPGEEPPDALRDELIQRLIDYRQVLAQQFAERHGIESKRLSRPTSPSPNPEEPAASITVWHLIRQAKDIAAWVIDYRRALPEEICIEPDDVPISDRADFLRQVLRYGPVSANRLLQEQPTLQHRCSLFLAMLAMAQDREIDMNQDGCFGPIQLRGRSITQG